MRAAIVLFLSLLSSIPSPGLDKAALDLAPNGNAKAAQNVPGFFAEASYQNDQIGMTLVPGGYFTLGTTRGLSASPLDDACAIAFGHPLALTSYPLFAIDGHWFRLDQFFPDGQLLPRVEGESLRIGGRAEDLVAVDFSLVAQGQGKITVEITLTNLDTNTRDLGVGLLFDPALGKWGDGHLLLDQDFIAEDLALRGGEVPNALTLWERRDRARGLGVALSFADAPPDWLAAANWPDLHQHNEPGYTPGSLNALYDLGLRLHWREQSVQGGQSLTRSVQFDLLEPDFSNSAFIRWDLPTAFTLTGNTMFPRAFGTHLAIANRTGGSLFGAEVELNLPRTLTTARPRTSLDLPAEQVSYAQFDLQSNLEFDEKVVPVRATLTRGGRVLDEVERNVYVPATPISNAGLNVEIDSLDLTAFPELALTFQVRAEATDRLLTNLTAENIRLHENQQEPRRIREFTLSKDTTEGANSADIVFVLDVTGSMRNEIEGVRANIVEFADSLESRSFDFRLGLITFRDLVSAQFPFTATAEIFRDQVSRQRATGGDDQAENSLEALRAATAYPFRPHARRLIVWITDADYHQNNRWTSLTQQHVVDALLANDIAVHSVGPKTFKSRFYDPITLTTGGTHYDIFGNFRDILLDISRFTISSKYRLVYTSPHTGRGPNIIDLAVHQAGLGGQATLSYSPPAEQGASAQLSYYPNPFNPEITFSIGNPGSFTRGKIEIFNTVGQLVKTIPLNHPGAERLVWNVALENGASIGAGVYLVRLSLTDQEGQSHRETARILYLK
ncbi:MAG: VWA domain-containing protein [Candidatus Latescibacteria bacterium]|nr:VWA domain-containing protein [Candidatus Latescibacterota bacterium]